MRSILLFGMLGAGDHFTQTAVAIVQHTVDPADGGAAGLGGVHDLGIDPALQQEGGHIKALLHGAQFGCGAEVLKKIDAFFHRVEVQDRFVHGDGSLMLCGTGHRITPPI